MKKITLLALAVLLTGSAARADEAFDGFRDFCLAGRGASAPALAAADAAGWTALPQQFLGQLPQTDFQDAQGRVHPSGNGGSLLLTAHGSMPQAGPVRVCAVGVIPAGVSDLAGQLEAYAGVAKQTADNLPEGLYAWREENGHHVSVDRNAPDFRAQVASGAVLIATTRSTPQMTMILLMSAVQ